VILCNIILLGCRDYHRLHGYIVRFPRTSQRPFIFFSLRFIVVLYTYVHIRTYVHNVYLYIALLTILRERHVPKIEFLTRKYSVVDSASLMYLLSKMTVWALCSTYTVVWCIRIFKKMVVILRENVQCDICFQ